MNRSADGRDQARADLDVAAVSAASGHHEWACFACHHGVEKALKSLHLHHGQQVWAMGWIAPSGTALQGSELSWRTR